MFFSFDGIDGAGKSTQVSLFVQWLRDQGREVIACRDPGSTPLGEAIRGVLLDRHDLHIHRRSEMLLYMAARAQLVEEVIRPALAEGKTVVSDRFLLANVVYQAYAGGLDVDEVKRVGKMAVAGVMPDLTFVLDIDAEAAAARLTRSLDRMESQGIEYLRRVRSGFLEEARLRPEAIHVIDASGSVDAIQAEIREAARRFEGSSQNSR
jgi:dTMP kinase